MLIDRSKKTETAATIIFFITAMLAFSAGRIATAFLILILIEAIDISSRLGDIYDFIQKQHTKKY